MINLHLISFFFFLYLKDRSMGVCIWFSVSLLSNASWISCLVTFSFLTDYLSIGWIASINGESSNFWSVLVNIIGKKCREWENYLVFSRNFVGSLIMCYDQGEAPAFIADDLQGDFSNGLVLKSKGNETVIDMGCNRTVWWFIISNEYYYASICRWRMLGYG